MFTLDKIPVMPTKLRYKLLVAFCLMSLMPILIGLYVVSLFVKFPFIASAENLATISVIVLFSLGLSFLGYLVTKQLINPIITAAQAAKKIAAGKLDEMPKGISGADELDDLSHSLKVISSNARSLIEEVEKLSLRDRLTGLYNLSYIRERLGEEIQRAFHFQKACTFAYLSVENFESYRAVRGDTAADDAIRILAKIIRQHLPVFNPAAKVANSDFALIFPGVNQKKAVELIQTIQNDLSLSQVVRVETKLELKLGLSAGVSENPIDGNNAETLFVKAQERMKKARARGNNLVESF